MRSLVLLSAVTIACCAGGTGVAVAGAVLAVKRLYCEYATAPNNIDRQNPRFTWILDSNARGQVQTAYRVLVSRSAEALAADKPDQWDSGRVASSQTAHVRYQGKPLRSNTQYFWKVIVWDRAAQATASEPSTFSTALLTAEDWSARWIGAGPETQSMPPEGFFQDGKETDPLVKAVEHDGRSVLLRRDFTCRGEIKTARVFVTGLGYYELYLNGRKVGDHVLAPAKTNYRKQVLYDTYDVTEYVKKGNNAVGIHLGNGWFNPYKKWWRPYRMQFFGAKRALMQLIVEYANGETVVLATDANWKQSPGPVLFNCVYDGETYDAGAEQEGWAAPGFDDSRWQPVHVVQPPGGELISHRMPPIRITEEITPVEVVQIDANRRVYDMGQNFAGWAKISLRGPKGTKVILRFAEDKHADGSIDVTSNEHAQATATYILRGGGVEVYEPRFTFFGFRYVEVRGEPELPTIDGVRGCVVHTDCERTGTFDCGNDLVNRIHRATVWSQRSSMMGYPLDCPQRDERLGWLGDAQVTAEEAMFNVDAPLYYENWLGGIRANQDPATGDVPIISPRPYIQDEGVEWSSTYLIVVWRHYLHYGDEEILARHYPAMKRYVRSLESQASGHILKQGWIGDWGSVVEGWKEGEPPSVPTAFFFYDATLLARIAKVLGKTDDAAYYADLAQRIKNAFNAKFLDVRTKNYNDGSQMANAFPLFLGIVPAEARSEVLQNLTDDVLHKHNGHLTTGVLGSKYMIDALVREGRADVAFALATQTGYPSWGHMVENHTTLCEFWNLKQSHNHVMMGSIDAFFYKTLAGIHVDEDKPGFENSIVRPFVPKGLSHARASIETIRGTLAAGWENRPEEFKMTLTIPVNTTADVFAPNPSASEVLENGMPAQTSPGVKLLRAEGGASVYAVESGEYVFTVKK